MKDKEENPYIEKNRYIKPLDEQPTIDVYCAYCGTLLLQAIPTPMGIDNFVVGEIECIVCRKTFYIDVKMGVYIKDTHEFVKEL